MIYYSGLWFWIPSFIGFIAFWLAMNVCIRINNLHLPARWRWGAYLAALLALVQSVVDLNETHCYESAISAHWAVAWRCAIRACYIFIILLVYHGLAQSFPRRMLMSRLEPSPSCRIPQ